MKKIAKVNGKQVKEDVFEQFIQSNVKNEEQLSKNEENFTLIDVFKRPKLRKMMFLLCIMWMSTSFVFDGHARNAGSIGSDIFIVHTIGSFTEFPADVFLVLILDSWGRRWPCGGALILGGIFSLVATIVPFGNFVSFKIV